MSERYYVVSESDKSQPKIVKSKEDLERYKGKLENPKFWDFETLVKAEEYYNALQNKRNDKKLIMACRTGDFQKCQRLISAGARVNYNDRAALTPMYQAVIGGSVEIVNLLLENGARIEGESGNGDSYLHLATKKQNIEVVKFLIEHGIDVNHRNYDNYSPVMFAFEKGDLELIKVFLEHEIPNNEKFYILKRASRYNNVGEKRMDIAEIIIDDLLSREHEKELNLKRLKLVLNESQHHLIKKKILENEKIDSTLSDASYLRL